MSVKSELFELIQSLNGPEKRYFSIYANQHSPQKHHQYRSLYDVLHEMEAYDEQTLRDHPSIQPFRHQVPFYKNYLKKLILRSLREFYRDKTPEMELRGELSLVELLYDRGLHGMALRRVRRIREKAEKKQLYHFLLEAIRWESRFVRIQQAKDFRTTLRDLTKKLEVVTGQLMEEVKLEALYNQLLSFVSNHIYPRKQEELDKIAELIQNPILTSPDPPKGKKAKVYFFLCKVYSSQLLSDHTGVVSWYEQLLNLLSDPPPSGEKEEELYLKTLLGFLDGLLNTQDFNRFLQYRGRLRQTISDSPAIKAMVFKSWVHLQIRYCLNSEKYQETGALDEEVRHGFEKYTGYISLPTRLSFAFNLQVIGLLAGEYRLALRWTNYILNHSEKESREDILTASLVFNSILHFELGNYDHVASRVRNSQRTIKTRKYDMNFEQIVLRALHQIVNSGPDQQRRLFTELDEDLSHLVEQNQGDIVGIKEVLLWIRNHKTG